MELNEFKDRLFDILNESEDLPILDLSADDKNDMIHIRLNEGKKFLIYMKGAGNNAPVMYNTISIILYAESEGLLCQEF
jgi:hypothetical protein